MNLIDSNPEKLDELRHKLSKDLSIQLSEEALVAIIATWNDWVSLRNKVQRTNLDDERNRLDKIITGLKEGLLSLKKLKEFGMPRFNTIFKLTDQTEAIALMEKELKSAEKTRLFLVNQGVQNQDWLKLVAMLGLFTSAEELGLKPLDKVGRGNKNPLKNFVGIITGLEDREEMDRYYSKYKKWKIGEINLI